MTIRIATIVLSFTVATVGAQSPPRRAHHALIYDQANGRVLLTGGSTPLDGGSSFQFFNDLWSFDGRVWTELPASGIPRSGQRLAQDLQSSAILSFGGYANGRSLGDLQRLERNRWQQISELAERPTAEGGFVFDAKRRRFVLFGGSAGRGQVHGDTWEFDGAAWTKISSTGPEPRQAFAMVYDTKRERTVLFGGMNGTGQPFGDTWEYDGRSWTRVSTTGPSPRNAAGAAFDSKRGIVILFGGAGPGGFARDTWSWDGSQWKQLAATGPAARAMGALAYDRQRDRIVLFGGRKGWPDDLADTWEWDGFTWKEVGSDARTAVLTSSGCAGPAASSLS